MKKKLLTIIALGLLTCSILTGCQSITKECGGETTMSLPANTKLELITWKDISLWYLTRPMTDDDIPETHTYQQQ